MSDHDLEAEYGGARIALGILFVCLLIAAAAEGFLLSFF